MSPDYGKAATELLIRHKKRALVIILTNTRDEDSDDLLPAIKLLKKRTPSITPQVFVEASIENTLNKPIEGLQGALDNSATQHYLQQRQKTFEQLIASGINTMDVNPQKLTVELINAYLGIKK